jgi:glycosyltransferase involved in cell wall biosynthesis
MSEIETKGAALIAPGASAADSRSQVVGPLKGISIVSACRNERKHIRAFIDSLLAQDLAGFDWEIIIADGASEDGTKEALSEVSRENPRVAVIDNPSRIVSTGLNAAIRAARGDIILRMDAHTEYASDYIQRCVETLETSGAQNVGGPARTRAEGLRAGAIQAAYHSRFSTGGAKFHDENYTGFVDTVTYGCWRKETLLKLGLFDEKLVRNQDDELNLRLTRAGGKIWQSAEIVSWYRPRATLSALFRQYFQYGFWKVAVIRKHRIPGSWRHLIPGVFVAGNIALLLAALCLAVAGRGDLAEKALLGWAAVLAAYVLASIIASVAAAKKFGWQLLPYLPGTFAVFHVSYGLGFLLGSVYWTFARSTDSRLGELFVGVTR